MYWTQEPKSILVQFFAWKRISVQVAMRFVVKHEQLVYLVCFTHNFPASGLQRYWLDAMLVFKPFHTFHTFSNCSVCSDHWTNFIFLFLVTHILLLSSSGSSLLVIIAHAYIIHPWSMISKQSPLEPLHHHCILGHIFSGSWLLFIGLMLIWY